MPYYGGRRECDVGAPPGEEEAKFDPSTLVCGGCLAGNKATCDKHGNDSIEYKCRFVF